MIRQADRLDKLQARKAGLSLHSGDSVEWACRWTVRPGHPYTPHTRPTNLGWDRRQGSGVGELLSFLDGEVGVMGSELSGGVRGNEQTAMLRQQPPQGH